MHRFYVVSIFHLFLRFILESLILVSTLHRLPLVVVMVDHKVIMVEVVGVHVAVTPGEVDAWQLRTEVHIVGHNDDSN